MQTKLRRETWRQGTTFVDDGIKKQECSVWPLTLRLPYGAGHFLTRFSITTPSGAVAEARNLSVKLSLVRPCPRPSPPRIAMRADANAISFVIHAFPPLN